MFDIVNHDTCRYRIINLLFGLYDQGKLLNVITGLLSGISDREKLSLLISTPGGRLDR